MDFTPFLERSSLWLDYIHVLKKKQDAKLEKSFF